VCTKAKALDTIGAPSFASRTPCSAALFHSITILCCGEGMALAGLERRKKQPKISNNLRSGASLALEKASIRDNPTVPFLFCSSSCRFDLFVDKVYGFFDITLRFTPRDTVLQVLEEEHGHLGFFVLFQ